MKLSFLRKKLFYCNKNIKKKKLNAIFSNSSVSDIFKKCQNNINWLNYEKSDSASGPCPICYKVRNKFIGFFTEFI